MKEYKILFPTNRSSLYLVEKIPMNTPSKGNMCHACHFSHYYVLFIPPETNSVKLGKEYIKAVYCHLAYLPYLQTTPCEMLAA